MAIEYVLFLGGIGIGLWWSNFLNKRLIKARGGYWFIERYYHYEQQHYLHFNCPDDDG